MFLRQPGGGPGLLLPGGRFVVGKKRQAPPGGGQAVAHTNAGMIRKPGIHPHGTDVESHRPQLLNFKMAGHIVQAHRKERTFHLAGQHRGQAGAGAFITEHPQMRVGTIQRREVGQALDVIPVGVRKQQVQVEGTVLVFLHQPASQRPHARAGIQDDDLPCGTHLHARGVAAVSNRARTGGRNGSAHSPESYAGPTLRGGGFVRGGRRRSFGFRRGEAVEDFLNPVEIERLLQIIARPGLQRRRAIRLKHTARRDHQARAS